MKQVTRRRMGRGMALTAAVGAALAMATVGTAQAATPGVFKLCSKGSYDSYAAFPDRGGMATTVVPSGQCVDFDLVGDKPEPVEIRQSGGAVIGPVTYDGRAGLNIATVDGPSFHPF
ncbi:hypothetical protein OOZ19_15970 [Saccharopolyspora sp. NFXS83]|uniref:hypothetical protein n=1 Tax=Saccharopolyspora sp. NFXS83 TaxID=2993560 RepID=UPI00224AE098|nr:hypothetical protein [Saccharopolyspora sp. NFXS83]MCX2731739.1 hypothetical protein [Saccharopolyspora sp. NFXS83]